MISKSFSQFAFILAFVFASMANSAIPQMAPKTLCIIRNDTTSQLTIEFHAGDAWNEIKLDPQKDTQFSGDRIRVATTRSDNATVTVDLPVEGGKKYRIFWNDQTSMWDFSSAG